jgi:hypothetical protein
MIERRGYYPRNDGFIPKLGRGRETAVKSTDDAGNFDPSSVFEI